jgi:hypothetical protein
VRWRVHPTTARRRRSYSQRPTWRSRLPHERIHG